MKTNIYNLGIVPLAAFDRVGIILLRPTFQYPLAIFVAFSAQKGVHPLTATKGYASGLKCGSPVGCGEPLFGLWVLPRVIMTMTYKTLAKICAAISFLSIAYMYVITLEGTYFGWILFFGGLAFAILFHALDKKEEEIARLRSPEEKQEEEKRRRAHWKELAETDPRSNDPFYGSSAVLSQEEKDKILNKFKKKEEMQAVFFRKNPKKPNKDPNHNETRK